VTNIAWRDPEFVFIDLMRLHDICKPAFDEFIGVLEIEDRASRDLQTTSSELMNVIDIFRHGDDIGFRRSSEIVFVYDNEFEHWLESPELTEKMDASFPLFPVKCW